MVKDRLVIFDLDGVLAQIGPERLKFFTKPDGTQWTHGDATGFVPDHQGFNASAAHAPAILPMVELNRTLALSGKRIAIVTGRDESSLEMTKSWMRHHGVLWNFLLMRGENDKRPDHLIKEMHLLALMTYYDVVMAFEDRDSVVTMYRSHGIICNQTNKALY